MNPYHYLESRFVTSQISLNRKQSTGGHAENHAILAWMWITLKVATLYYLCVLLIQYLGVALHLTQRPKQARDLALAEAERQILAKKEAEKFAAQVTNVTNINTTNEGGRHVENTD